MLRSILLVCLLVTVAIQEAGSQQPHDSLVGAVRTVDVRARTLDVTIGVGFALRLVRIQVPLDTRITAAEDTLRFDELSRGDVVRVSFGNRDTTYVAYAIERLGDMRSGRDSTP